MELVQHAIPVKGLGQPVHVALVGDLQWSGSKGPTAKDTLRRFLDRCQELNAYYIGMGDYPMPTSARILTRRGFLAHDEVAIGEPVLAYDASRERCVWTPLRRINRPGALPMIRLRSKSFAVRSTPQHTWVVTQNWWVRSGARAPRRKFKPYLVAAADLKSHHRLVVAARVDDSAESVLGSEESRILGWLCTDGHVRATATSVCGYILQTKEPYRTHLRGILAEWITKEEQPEEPMSRFHLKTKRLRALFESAGLNPMSYKTQLPGVVTRLSHEARVSMWTAMLEAEGWREGDRWRFSQKPGPVLEAFRILSALLGYRLSRGKVNTAGVVTVAVMASKPVVTVADLKMTPAPAEECWCPATDYGTWVAELDGQVTITGNTDFMSPGNRVRLRSAALHDTAVDVIDAKALDLTQELYDGFLRNTKGRWLGLVEGHHFVELTTGDTTDMRLCQTLDAPFLGTSAYINLVFKVGKDTSSYFHTTFWVTHGIGSGTTPAAMLNKLKNMAATFQRADVYAAGHCTRLSVDRIQRPYPVWNSRGGKDGHKLRHQDVLLVVTGGFMASYRQGSKVGKIPRGGYGERAMYAPSALAAPIIQLVPWRTRVDDEQVAQVEMTVLA